MKAWLVFLLCLPAAGLWATDNLEEALNLSRYPAPQETPKRVLIKGATVWTQTGDGVLENTDVLIEDGKIARVGKNLRAGRNALVFDAKGKHVTPGLIDAHSHSAVEGGWAGSVNEATNNITAEVRIQDVFNPWSGAIYRELAGGLTAGNLLHGSANSIGGQNMIFKYRWGAINSDDFVIKTAPPGIKFALGENPIRVGGGERYPNSRMGVINSIRVAFNDALAYREGWNKYNAMSDDDKAKTKPPRKNLQLDTILEILDGKRDVHSHGYRQDEYLALIRLAEEYKIQIATFQHILEGFKIADEMAAAGIGGSTFADWWAYKFEAYDAIPQNAALMHERGVVSSVNSDDEVLARRLNIEAAKSLRYGMSEAEALGLVTNYPAIQLGIDDVTGSLAKGKDADVVVWNGHPLEIASTPEYTLVEGVVVFSMEADKAHREKIMTARTTLVEALRNEGKEEKPEESEEGESESGEETAAAEPEAESEESETAESADEESSEPEAEPAAEEKPKPNPAAKAKAYNLSPYAAGQVSAIVGGTVHTLAGEAIENGVVVIADGRITAVGGADTQVPAGADVYDAKGKHVWPGIFHSWSYLGLYEVGAVDLTVDAGESGRFDPELSAFQAFNGDSKHIPVARTSGITHAFVRTRAGNVSGVGSIMKTAGWTYEDMGADHRAALVLGWPEGSTDQSLEERKTNAKKAVERITEFFDNAEWYRKAKDAAGDGTFETNTKYEAMIPILSGELPLYVDVRADWAIKEAHAWCAKRGYRLIVVGGDDAWKIADYLAENNLPVILTSALRSPTVFDEPYDIGYTQPGKLAAAGVVLAIAGAENGAAHLRNIVEHAGTASGFGLDRTEAYKTMTLNPAKIFGLDADLGTIESGKVANLIVTNGDLLEVSTVVEQAWVDGIAADMGEDKQKRLYEKYRNRPKTD